VLVIEAGLMLVRAEILSHETRDTRGGDPCAFLSGPLVCGTPTHVIYTIKVTVLDPDDAGSRHSVLIYKRFSDFVRLHSRLGGGPGLERPSKSVWRYWQRFDEGFVQSRKANLQTYLDTLFAQPVELDRVLDWNDPTSRFFELIRLLPGQAGLNISGALPLPPPPGGDRSISMEAWGSPPPPPPPRPRMEIIQASASTVIQRVVRGRRTRESFWELLKGVTRPLYIRISHVSGYGKAAGSPSLIQHYNPYVIVTAIDPTTGKQLSHARTDTYMVQKGEAELKWNEVVLLSSVYPDCILCFTVCDQCSIGRDNFLGQGIVYLSQDFALSTKFPSSATGASTTGRRRVGNTGAGGSAVDRRRVPSEVADSGFGAQKPDAEENQKMGAFARRHQEMYPHGDPAGIRRGHRRSASALGQPAGALTTALRKKQQDVWPGATSTGNPVDFDYSVQWQFGELRAEARWCPRHASKTGFLYKLSQPMIMVTREVKWVKRWVVLADDCIMYFNSRDDFVPKAKHRVDAIARINATSASLMAPSSVLPANTSDEHAFSVQFDFDEEWLFLVEGEVEYGEWRARLNAAIFSEA